MLTHTRIQVVLQVEERGGSPVEGGARQTQDFLGDTCQPSERLAIPRRTVRALVNLIPDQQVDAVRVALFEVAVDAVARVLGGVAVSGRRTGGRVACFLPERMATDRASALGGLQPTGTGKGACPSPFVGDDLPTMGTGRNALALDPIAGTRPTGGRFVWVPVGTGAGAPVYRHLPAGTQLGQVALDETDLGTVVPQSGSLFHERLDLLVAIESLDEALGVDGLQLALPLLGQVRGCHHQNHLVRTHLPTRSFHRAGGNRRGDGTSDRGLACPHLPG